MQNPAFSCSIFTGQHCIPDINERQLCGGLSARETHTGLGAHLADLSPWPLWRAS